MSVSPAKESGKINAAQLMGGEADDVPPAGPRVKNMIVRTKLAKVSMAPSTDMHSKTGQGTINIYQQFIDVHRKLPGIKLSQ